MEVLNHFLGVFSLLKVTFTLLKVTFSLLKVISSVLKVTFSLLKVTSSLLKVISSRLKVTFSQEMRPFCQTARPVVSVCRQTDTAFSSRCGVRCRVSCGIRYWMTVILGEKGHERTNTSLMVLYARACIYIS